MRIFKNHLILSGSKVKDALQLLNKLSQDAILFMVDIDGRLIGSLTDGDVRRGFLNGFNLESSINDIIQKNPKFIKKDNYSLQKVIEYRDSNFRILPIVDKDKKIINIINFRKIKSYLPLDAVIMAGGRGSRLKPLTDTIPKPLLKVGSKAIIDYNIERLALYGVDDFWISIKHLGEQVKDHLGSGKEKSIKINYVQEKEPLGTIGAISSIKNFKHDHILLTNSDLLTNIDYELFFLEFIKQNADCAILTIPYQVNIPYAVLETENGNVKSLKEKPTYSYYSNGGVYIFKKEAMGYIPKGKFFNATDLIDKLIKENLKVVSIPFSGYWLDIGKHEDFDKAQIDINKIKF